MTSWSLSLLGGALIGVSASIAWGGAGRIAGVSGILGGFRQKPRVRGFRPAFLMGLLMTSSIIGWVSRARPLEPSDVRPLVGTVIAGLLVGFGTQLGGGCTSGHGVCGISRLSKRSLVATGTFMLCAMAVVFVSRHVLRGALP
jgi:uncharacterized protein